MRLPSDYAAPKQEQEVVEYIWEQKGCGQQRREPIVRCRDCRYYGCYDGSSWCNRTYEQVSGGTCDYQTVEPDGFCAWGERREP